VTGNKPRRGEIYLADLDPVVGREQGGQRPFLVLSILAMSKAPANLVIGLPVTTTEWPNSLHVRIEPAHSGLPRASYAMPEMMRSVSTQHFKRRIGRVPIETFELAANRAGFLIGLGITKF
jgi:mRNA interferase MazF